MLCQIWLNYLPWIGRSNCIQFFAQPRDYIHITLEKNREFESLRFNGDHVAENELLNEQVSGANLRTFKADGIGWFGHDDKNMFDWAENKGPITEKYRKTYIEKNEE